MKPHQAIFPMAQDPKAMLHIVFLLAQNLHTTFRTYVAASVGWARNLHFHVLSSLAAEQSTQTQNGMYCRWTCPNTNISGHETGVGLLLACRQTTRVYTCTHIYIYIYIYNVLFLSLSLSLSVCLYIYIYIYLMYGRLELDKRFGFI
jgi:hypothetical protein